ncbi:MAG: Rrf2 family transcriptional regulator [Lachnospiraceae bacterium]|nr:Rrf2 family transcriptional regulator [Lachnospiraceae bacterium]MBQ9606157.1 Rrf2 family transcriptional regulator [Lachnospiraceae bacterium]
MKISTKGTYAIQVMLDLAIHNTGENINVKKIAERQDISEKYLEQIIAVLNKAGFVKSIRGAQGGYRLAKAPAEYTVGDILRVTEGPLEPVSVNESPLSVWKKLTDAINDVVDSITLQDLVDEENARSGGDYII